VLPVAVVAVMLLLAGLALPDLRRAWARRGDLVRADTPETL
jgi:hypothetical protein